jgi:hypothetical protein
VTLNAQNRPKLGHRRPWRLLMSAGDTQRETELTEATEADWLTGARDFKCAEPTKTRPSSSVAVTYVGGWYTEGDRAYSKRLKLIG